MKTRPLLMGVETEYAVSALRRDGDGPAADEVLLGFVRTVARLYPNILDVHSGTGVFLGNGARFYVDVGAHPELATPECTSPYELVTYVRAGERIMLEAARAIAVDRSGNAEVAVLRSNVDYTRNHTSWGCHESYLHTSRADALPDAMIPHFVSRLIYTGAGGFNPRAPGVEFTLSPRVHLLERVISEGSTTARGIFHTKNESLGSGSAGRLHVICGESVCSDVSTLLKVGTTALIVAAVDAGKSIGDGLALAAPLEAIRTFAADPDCRARVRLRNGRDASAIEIQRQYLQRVEACREEGHLPDWTAEVCRLWSRTLDALESEPRRIARTLDWGIKLALFRHWVGDDEAWRALTVWNQTWSHVCERVASVRDHDSKADPLACLDILEDRSSEAAREAYQLGDYLASRHQDWAGLRRFLTLRSQLLEIDVRFGQLGPRGIYQHLLERGRLDTTLIDDAAVERATRDPPPSSRAAVRGRLIKQLDRRSNKTDHRASWTRIWNLSKETSVDLSDPFETNARWVAVRDKGDGVRRLLRLLGNG